MGKRALIWRNAKFRGAWEKGIANISKEGAMPDKQVHAPQYPTVEFVLEAVAGWINKYRQAGSLHDELGHCSPEDVMEIAKDLGVPVSELRKLATKGPGAADLIKKMLIALRVDPHVLANTNPAVMRDLQRLCVVCSQKGRCEHELAKGTASEHLHEFCPNAFTLNALFKQKGSQPQP
ncbi:MAG: hypothetical protein WAL49_04530 [Pseudolabrys sp.]